MSSTETERKSGPKARSPSYPGVNLETAIQRAEELYREETAHPAHIDTILDHWGYKPKVGPGLVTFAALKKFGLLTDEGSGDNRRGRLTDLALRIIQDTRPDSAERAEAIREAALTPAIHRELWDHYQGTLPSDGNLRFTLLRDRHFTERGASEFIEQFRATVAFARLGDADNMSSGGGDEKPEHPAGGGKVDRGGGTGLLNPPAPPLQDAYKVPLGAGRAALLQLPSPFTERDWDQMLRVLEAMKPGLVEEPVPSAAWPPSTDPEEDEQD